VSFSTYLGGAGLELNPVYALFHITTPYPGTKLHTQARSDPNSRFSDESVFPGAVEGRFTLRELKALTRGAYVQYCIRPSYLLSRLAKREFRALAKQLNLFWSLVNS
jgi:hypothetical protein